LGATDPGALTTVGRSRRRHGAARMIGIAILVGMVLVGAYIGITFVQVWSTSRPGEVEPASAIVVLGAAQYDGRPSPVLRARLDHAAELYERGVAEVVVVSGGKQAGDRTTEGKAGYDYLRSRGIPDSALKVETGGTDTFSELSATSLILSNAKLGKDVVLVTDGFHAARSVAIAGQLGLDAQVSPTVGEASFAELARETGAVALGRIVGFRRLSNVT